MVNTAPSSSVASRPGPQWWPAGKYGIIKILIVSVIEMILAAVLTGYLLLNVIRTLPLIESPSSFEVSFIIAGTIVEPLLFVGSIVGCISVLKRSRFLLQRYAYFKFIHIIINLAAIAFLWAEIIKFNTSGYTVDQCWVFAEGGLPCQDDTDNGSLEFTIVYFVVGAMILILELYSVITLFSYLKGIKELWVSGTTQTHSISAIATSTHTSRQDATRLEEGQLHPASQPEIGKLELRGDMKADLLAQAHQRASVMTCYSNMTDPLEESKVKLTKLGTDTQMTREELLDALMRAREDLVTERLRGGMNAGQRVSPPAYNDVI